MAVSKGAGRVREIVDVLRRWQGLERQAMADVAEIIEETNSPLVGLVMDIIRHDSLMHHRVQQFLIETLTRADVPVTREDVAKIWDKIEAHNKLEKKTIELATVLREEAWSPVHKQLLGYLLVDEAKHESLLSGLNELKQGMTRASGG